MRRLTDFLSRLLPGHRSRSLDRDHAVILTFHRIRPAGVDRNEFDTCPSHSVTFFQFVLNYLNNAFDVVSLSNLAERLHEHKQMKNMCAITFDDGWRDNYDVAYPLLRSFNFPATIFLTTGKIGSSEPFWQQKLGCIFERQARTLSSRSAQDCMCRFLRNSKSSYVRKFRSTVRHLKTLSPGTLARRLDEYFASQDEPDVRQRLFLDWTEIREMSQNGIDFGSHTVTHPILTSLQKSAMRQELAESKETIERHLCIEVRSLAYPNGSYNPMVVEIARNVGYGIACTTQGRRIHQSENLLALPRIELPWDNEQETSVPIYNTLQQWLHN